MGDQVNSSLLSVHFSNEYEIRHWSHSPENPMIRAADVARWKINKLRIFLILAPAGGSPSTWGLATRCSNTCHTVSFFFCLSQLLLPLHNALNVKHNSTMSLIGVLLTLLELNYETKIKCQV